MIIIPFSSFLKPALADGFSLEFERQQSPQVSRILLSIVVDLNNVVAWMVSICPLIFKSSSPFNHLLVTVLRAPITIGITATYMLHGFLIPWLGRIIYLSFRFLYYYYLLLESFSYQLTLMIFHWSLTFSKCPQISRIITIIIIIINYSFRVFQISITWWFFHWNLSESNSPQVSRTLLSILAVFKTAVVWMVSTRPPTSKSSRSFNNPLVTLPKTPITISTIVTFMFHSFFNSVARSWYLSFFSHYYYYYYYYYY